MRVEVRVIDDADKVIKEDSMSLYDTAVCVVSKTDGADNQVSVTIFEPHAIDSHPDTLREIGGLVVRQATGK